MLVTHLTTETDTLYANQGGGLFLDRTRPSGLATDSWAATAFGTAFVDVDQDGWLDLVAVGGAVTYFHARSEGGSRTPLEQPGPSAAKPG